jgi:CHAD domain-containing protein
VQNLAADRSAERTNPILRNGAAGDWILDTVAGECAALDRARRRFVREPTAEGLHHVRTGARRLRSLLEDVAALHRQTRLLRRVKRTAGATDAARDGAVQRELLERLLDDGEREAAEPLMDILRERERRATKAACRKLRRVRFETTGRKK